MLHPGLLFCNIFLTDPRMEVLIGSLSNVSSSFTTISATALITYRIIHITRQSPERRSYYRIIEVIIESAFLVSLIQLIQTIVDLISVAHEAILSTKRGEIIYWLSGYLGYLLQPATVCISMQLPQTESYSYALSFFLGNCAYPYCFVCHNGAQQY